MPSKSKSEGTAPKRPAAKRASIPRESGHSKSFKKDWERYDKAARDPMADVKSVMQLIIANDGPLPPQYKDHELNGDWDGCRDCHVHGDLLLIYKIEGRGADEKVIFLALKHTPSFSKVVRLAALLR